MTLQNENVCRQMKKSSSPRLRDRIRDAEKALRVVDEANNLPFPAVDH